MHLQLKLTTELLSDTALEQIFQSAVRILRQVPFRIQGTPELMDCLSALGCQIDGERVRIPSGVIDTVIGRIREQKERRLETSSDANDWCPGNEVSMFTHGQAILACDLETNELRPATKQDLEVWCHVVDALGDVSRSHPTFLPTDVPNSAVDFNAYATIILNSREPHRVSVYNANMLRYFIEASEVVYGSMDAVKQKAPFATKMWVNSPFMITRENVEIAMEARRRLGRPIHPATMPCAGAATPVTIAGALAQSTAEGLGLNAITLAVEDRLCGFSCGPVVIDMQSASPRSFGPDAALHRSAANQMHAYLFGGQYRGFPGIGPGAQVVSPQALYEKAMDTALCLAGGNRAIGIGSLAASDVGSLVQLMLDYEMGCFFRHLLRDVTVDAAHIDEETIIDVAQRGAYYMDTDHTARFFREAMWLPRLNDYRLAGAWQEDPSDIIARARDQARQMVETAENQCPLSDGQKAEVQRLLDTANREAADSLTR